jgi:hypothetical protein
MAFEIDGYASPMQRPWNMEDPEPPPTPPVRPTEGITGDFNRSLDTPGDAAVAEVDSWRQGEGDSPVRPTRAQVRRTTNPESTGLEDRIAELQAQVAFLTRQLAALSKRLDALEQ